MGCFMFCMYCGKKNSDDSVFCSYCGKKTSSITPNEDKETLSQSSTHQIINEQVQFSDNKHNDNNTNTPRIYDSKYFLIICIIPYILCLFILFNGLLGTYFFFLVIMLSFVLYICFIMDIRKLQTFGIKLRKNKFFLFLITMILGIISIDSYLFSRKKAGAPYSGRLNIWLAYLVIIPISFFLSTKIELNNSTTTEIKSYNSYVDEESYNNMTEGIISTDIEGTVRQNSEIDDKDFVDSTVVSQLEDKEDDYSLLNGLDINEKKLFFTNFIDTIFQIYSSDMGISYLDFDKKVRIAILNYYIEISKQFPDRLKKYGLTDNDIDRAKALKSSLSKLKNNKLKEAIDKHEQNSSIVIYANIRHEDPEYDDGSEYDEFFDVVFGFGADYQYDATLESNGIINPKNEFQFAIAFINSKVVEINKIKKLFPDRISLFIPCSESDIKNWNDSNLSIFKSMKWYKRQDGDLSVLKMKNNTLWLESVPVSSNSVCEVKIIREH